MSGCNKSFVFNLPLFRPAVTLKSRISALARPHIYKWLASLRENNRTNNRLNAPSPQNSSNCCPRGIEELQAYENCYTTDVLK